MNIWSRYVSSLIDYSGREYPRFEAVLFSRVGNAEQTGKLAVERHKHHRLAFLTPAMTTPNDATASPTI
jgi:hypothetical protein